MEPNNQTGKTPEVTVLVAYKHLFGLFTIYAQVIIGLGASLLLIYLLLPTLLGDGSGSGSHSIVAASTFVVLVLAGFILLLATVVYRGNKLVVSNKNVRQYSQTGLFHTALSQLSLANIEDVTARKEGFFATVLNYGFLTIETAGEQENFEFYFCPNANHVAEVILNQRAEYVAQHPGEAS